MPIVIYRKSGGFDLMRDPFGNELPDEMVDAEIEKWKEQRWGNQVNASDYDRHERIVNLQLPDDRQLFRKAWRMVDGKITHDLDQCKAIAHDRRRAKRAEEFKPLDVEATIPAKASEAEAKRQAIRDKYAAMQSAIDAAKTAQEIREAIK